MAVDIDSLQIEIEATSSDAASKIEQLATALTNLKSAAKGGAGLTTTTKQLQALSNAAKLINGTNLNSQKIQQFASAMNSLANIQKASGLSSTINALKKLPDISTELDKADLGKFARQMNQVAAAMRPLATEMQKVANGFSAFPIRIQKIIQSNSSLTASNNKTAKSFGVLGTGISSAQAKFGVYLIAFRQLASVMSDWVKESNDYVENLNLFTVAMGDYAAEAKAYAEEVQAAMGIDPSEWMRNQGVFMQMASGFGVASDSAALMSKNLTQLGYDISSFYNISIEEAMQKLQSGIAGEIEPLRRLGYAIDVASLEQVALNHGITESVNAMTQAEKAQLRYVAIMEQSTNAMGDIARTVQTPANATRILSQQITQLSRALGNLLIPLLQQIIPWVQAFVEILTEAVQALAVLFGFELPTIDYSGIEGVSVGASDAEEAIDGVTSSAKEMKRELLGIDELTILEPASSGGTGGVSGGVSGGDFNLELPGYDFLGGLETSKNKIKDFLKDISDEIIAIGSGFAAWKIAPKVLSWFSDLKNGRFSKIDRLAAGIGLAVTGFTLEWQGAYDIGYNGPNFENVLKTLIGAALGVSGSLLIFGTGPLGWVIGIGTALTIAVSGIIVGYNKRKLENELKERFGEIELTVEEAKELAEKIMSSPLSIQLDAYVTATSNAENAIQEYLESANSLQDLVWRIRVGFEVEASEIESSVDSMIENAKSVLSTYREVYTLTVGISFSDVEIQSDMALFVNEYFNQSEADLVELGTELKQTILDAMADGIIDEQEMRTIQNLQAEVNQIMAAVADAEYRAQLNNAVFDLDGDLSYDSVKAISDELQTIAQQQLDTLEESHLTALTLIELKYKTDGNYEEYLAALDDEMNTYFSNQASVQGGAFQTLIDKYSEAFADVLAKSADDFAVPLENLINPMFEETFGADETGKLVDGSIRSFVEEVKSSWITQMAFASENMSGATRVALEESLDAITPHAEDMRMLADKALAAGEAVPQNIADGLVAYHQLAALSGNADSINYLLGGKFSSDPSFIEALSLSKDGAEMLVGAIADGFLDHTEIKANVDGTISFINDEIGELVVEYTPELSELFRSLGVKVVNDFGVAGESAVSGAIAGIEGALSSGAYNSGSNIGFQIGAGVAQGISNSKGVINQAANGAVSGAIAAMQKKALIYSPSRLFRDEVGVDIGRGVAVGIEDSKPYIEKASDRLLSVSILDMKSILKYSNHKYQNENGSKNYQSLSFADFGCKKFRVESDQNYSMETSDEYGEDTYRSSRTNNDVLNAITAAAQQIVSAIEENSGDVYIDADGTAIQNRRNRMYGKTLQRI